jgi:hypothetical protein
MVKMSVLVGSLLLPSVVLAQPSTERLETGVFFTYVFLERIGSRDAGPGTQTGGLGGRIVWRLMPYLDLDGELAVHPNAGVSGHRVQGFLGLKTGVRFRHVGLFAKVRPGFLYFSKDPFGVGARGSTFFEPQWAQSLDPSLDIGGVFEYYTPRGVVVRFDFSDTIVSYSARTVFSSQLLPPRSVGGFTTHNRQWSLGAGYRF